MIPANLHQLYTFHMEALACGSTGVPTLPAERAALSRRADRHGAGAITTLAWSDYLSFE